MNKTPLYEHHESLGARIVEFGGWLLPVQYEGVLAEHNHCRSEAVVFDTCHMGLFLFTGANAGNELGKICTQDAANLETGICKYGFLLNERGGILDDSILMVLGEDEYLLVVNAATAKNDKQWILSHLPNSVQMTDLSADGWGKIDLQGPKSLEILAPLVEDDLSRLGYYRVTRTVCCGIECIIARAGYTGELGYEIMAPGQSLATIFTTLLKNETVKPAGLGARDSLRLESCYPLYGHEHDSEKSPLCAGMGKYLNGSNQYIGYDAIRSISENPPDTTLVAFKADSRRRAGEGNPILHEGRPIGHVTSSAFSPSLETSIGMGYVNIDYANKGTQLTIDTGRAELPVTIHETPLYRKGTCRINVRKGEAR